MADNSRRRFLKGSAGVVAGAAIGACAQDAPPQESERIGLDHASLEALAMLVLPRTALGDAGIKRVTGEFIEWLEAFDPVSELNHPYYLSPLSSEHAIDDYYGDQQEYLDATEAEREKEEPEE